MTPLAEIEELAQVIDREMQGRSGSVQMRPAISFARVDPGARRLPVERLPGIAVLARGAKSLHSRGLTYTSNCSAYVVSTKPVVAELEVLGGERSQPLLGMVVDLDLARLGELVVDIGEAPPSRAPRDEPLVSATIDRSLARAMLRLAHLVCSDRAWSALHEGAIREVYYWTLRGEAGPSLRHRVARAAGVERLAEAMRYIQAHLGDPLEIATIAKAAALSPSVLHASFKQVLGESPMQLVKRLRLEAARGRIAAGMPVTTAAVEVGYLSASQFSRDFRRRFGVAPSSVRGRTRHATGTR